MFVKLSPSVLLFLLVLEFLCLCSWTSRHCGLPLAERTCCQEWSVSENNEEQPRSQVVVAILASEQ